MRASVKRLLAANGAPTYLSDFSAGVDSWVQNAGDANLVLAGNVDAIGGVDNVLSCLASAGNRVMAIRRTGFNCSIGARYSLTFDFFAETGAFAAQSYLGMGISLARQNGGLSVPIVENAWQLGKKLVFTQRNESSLNAIFITAFTTPSGQAAESLLSGKRLYFKNFVLRPETI